MTKNKFSMDKNLIRKKAEGIIEAVSILGDVGKTSAPSKAFINDYNNLRALAISHGGVERAIAPPVGSCDELDMALESYADILSFATQLRNLLTE